MSVDQVRLSLQKVLSGVPPTFANLKPRFANAVGLAHRIRKTGMHLLTGQPCCFIANCCKIVRESVETGFILLEYGCDRRSSVGDEGARFPLKCSLHA